MTSPSSDFSADTADVNARAAGTTVHGAAPLDPLAGALPKRIPTEELFKPGSLDPVGDETLDMLLDCEMVTNRTGEYIKRHADIEHDAPLSHAGDLVAV